jgi:hypothetical protein
MKQIELTADLAIDHILRQAQLEDIVLVRQGHAVALVSEIDDEDLYWYARENDPEFQQSLRRARSQVRQGKTIGHEDLKRELRVKKKNK